MGGGRSAGADELVRGFDDVENSTTLIFFGQLGRCGERTDAWMDRAERADVSAQRREQVVAAEAGVAPVRLRQCRGRVRPSMLQPRSIFGSTAHAEDVSG